MAHQGTTGTVGVDKEERAACGESAKDVARDGQPVDGAVGEAEEGAVAEAEPRERQRQRALQPRVGSPRWADRGEADAVGVRRQPRENDA
jgi:hypothetical protein